MTVPASTGRRTVTASGCASCAIEPARLAEASRLTRAPAAAPSSPAPCAGFHAARFRRQDDLEVHMSHAQILVVEDHPIVRLGVRQMIASSPKLTICGE